MVASRIYPSKVILFGEYSIIQDSEALAIPAPQFSANWAYGQTASAVAIRDFANYLIDLEEQDKLFFELNIPELNSELDKNLYLESNIPIGYGLGSSGALCAAIYDTFARNKTDDWVQLKTIFAQMESHFHGASSGTDPLISYTQAAVRIQSSAIQACRIPPLKNTNTCFFLVNSNKARKSEVFINWFVEQCKKESYLNRLNTDFIPLVDTAIAKLCDGETNELLSIIHQISAFQQQHFQAMLLAELAPLWQAGLDSDFFKLKICGAGGGGFFLGYTTDWKRLQKVAENFPLTRLDICP